MGTGFMIDAPLRIAKYGISTVLSLVDDVLIEQMRKFHSQKEGEPYEPITLHDEDATAHQDQHLTEVGQELEVDLQQPFDACLRDFVAAPCAEQ